VNNFPKTEELFSEISIVYWNGELVTQW